MAHDKQVVLVTGGAGFLGQHVVKVLQEKGDDVKEIRVFDLHAYESKLGHSAPKPVKSIVGDLRHQRDVSDALEGVDCVIHTAGLVSFGTFPDIKGMEEVNVKGTENVIKGCIERSVSRLLYTSTIDVVIGYDDIINADETLAVPRRFLFPGYPDTKYRAERLVLEANGRPWADGDQCLQTLALRPNVMYGEGDPFYITSALRSAHQSCGVLQRIGNGTAIFQQAYVGNVAWGHVVANRALARDSRLGGHAYFLTDDTPLMNTFDFMEMFLKARGFSLSKFSIPYPFVYCLFYAAEGLLRCLRPVYEINLQTALCSVIYVNHTIFFSRRRAEERLGYRPLYQFKEAVDYSLKYYASIDL